MNMLNCAMKRLIFFLFVWCTVTVIVTEARDIHIAAKVNSIRLEKIVELVPLQKIPDGLCQDMAVFYGAKEVGILSKISMSGASIFGWFKPSVTDFQINKGQELTLIIKEDDTSTINKPLSVLSHNKDKLQLAFNRNSNIMQGETLVLYSGKNKVAEAVLETISDGQAIAKASKYYYSPEIIEYTTHAIKYDKRNVIILHTQPIQLEADKPNQAEILDNKSVLGETFDVRGEVSLQQPNGSGLPLSNVPVVLVSRHDDRWYTKTNLRGEYFFHDIPKAPRGITAEFYVVVSTQVSKITGAECTALQHTAFIGYYYRRGAYAGLSESYIESYCTPTFTDENLSWHVEFYPKAGYESTIDLYQYNKDRVYNQNTKPSLERSGGWQ